MKSDPWQWWRDAMAGQDMTSRTHDGEPNAGYYRQRSKDKRTGSITWRPVAYFLDADNVMQCVVGDEHISAQRAAELWTYVCRSPVSEADYRRVAEDGGNWSDQDSIVADQTNPGIGDNSSAFDEKEALSDQIATAAAGKKKYTKIITKEQSEQAQSLRSRLLELAGQAEKIRKAKADPLFKEYKEVNNLWNPVIKTAEDAAGEIKKANDDYLTGLLQEQRKAEREAEQSMVDETTPAPVVPKQVRGGYGRAAAVRTKWIVKSIDDYDLLYAHFKTSAAVKEALEGLAKKAVDDGEVPGVTREEVARS